MKIKFNTDWLVNSTVIVVVVFILICYIIQIVNSYDPGPNSYTPYDNSNRPVFDLSKQTPYNDYIKKQQEFNLLQDLRNGTSLSMSMACVIFGINQSSYCDTCTNYAATYGTKLPKRYYLTLPGWKLNKDPLGLMGPDTAIFHVKNGQAYVNTLVVQKPKKIGNTMQWVAKFKDIPVEYRYERRQDMVMIPVSYKTYNILHVTVAACMIILATWVFFNILEFIRFTISISKGDIFTWHNVLRLKIIALTLLTYPVATYILNQIIGLCLKRYFAGTVIIKTLVWENWQVYMGLGCVFLLLFKAFRRGTLLKEENDLTV